MFNVFGKKKLVSHKKMPIYINNTLSRNKEEFKPIKQGKVTIYTCGPTVYDYVHIGNLSSYIFADTLKRTFIYNDYDVNHTMNLTDFGHLSDDGDAGEDKMMKGLKREGKAITLSAMHDFADKYIEAFMNDMEDLNVVHANQYTRASEYIKEQIALIKTLDDKGYTYETSDGIYFDISKFPTYGEINNINLDKLKKGARVEINKEKHHPADFALWKKALLGWDSIWGKGFPGWHVECTAMSFATLGKQIDVHTGGEDLKYTHHNAEIAQAEACTNKSPYVKYWFHNAFITIDDTKISKSIGNGITLHNLTDRGYPADAFRYWVLTSHYDSQANFSFEALNGAKQALFRIKRHIFEDYLPARNIKANKGAKGTIDKKYQNKFQKAINDDLDTPKAIAILWELIKDDSIKPENKIITLKDMDSVLGIGLNDKRDEVIRELGIISPEDIPEDIQTLIDEREIARLVRNWEEADRLREALNIKGYTVEDGPDGPKISKE